MSHPFDATLKDILGRSAADLAPVLHLPTNVPARILNIDLSTVSAATDVAFGFGDPLQEIVDVNFQSGPDAYIASRLLLYNAAYHNRYPVPVRSILILLRASADLAVLTGQLSYHSGGTRVQFEYEMIRMWQQPLQVFLSGGLALLPLAPLCQLPEGGTLEGSAAGGRSSNRSAPCHGGIVCPCGPTDDRDLCPHRFACAPPSAARDFSRSQSHARFFRV